MAKLITRSAQIQGMEKKILYSVERNEKSYWIVHAYREEWDIVYFCNQSIALFFNQKKKNGHNFKILRGRYVDTWYFRIFHLFEIVYNWSF